MRKHSIASVALAALAACGGDTVTSSTGTSATTIDASAHPNFYESNIIYTCGLHILPQSGSPYMFAGNQWVLSSSADFCMRFDDVAYNEPSIYLGALWSSSNPAVATVTNYGVNVTVTAVGPGDATITALVPSRKPGDLGVSDTRVVHVFGQQTMSVNVSGQPYLAVGAGANFTATVSGGTPPYTYQWYVDGSLKSNPTPNFTWGFGPGGHQVLAKVTDATGYSQVGSFNVYVSTSPCYPSVC